jgi:hypothetical protein
MLQHDFAIQSLALFTLRCFTEMQWNSKRPEAPGRLASMIQGLCVGAWIVNNNYASAISSTLAYFVWDFALNIILGKGQSVTQFHHLIGFALCYYSLHTESYLDPGIVGQITHALIQMESTNISFQAAFLFYHEYKYPHLMIPALLHFFIIRVVVLGYYVHPLNLDVHKVVDSRFMSGLWGITLAMWILQISWFLLWASKIIQTL